MWVSLRGIHNLHRKTIHERQSWIRKRLFLNGHLLFRTQSFHEKFSMLYQMLVHQEKRSWRLKYGGQWLSLQFGHFVSKTGWNGSHIESLSDLSEHQKTPQRQLFDANCFPIKEDLSRVFANGQALRSILCSKWVLYRLAKTSIKSVIRLTNTSDVPLKSGFIGKIWPFKRVKRTGSWH